MDMYNLNYNGGMKAFGMLEKLAAGEVTVESVEADIKSFQENPNYKSDSGKMQDVLNKLNTETVNIGKNMFDVKPSVFRQYSILHRLYRYQ